MEHKASVEICFSAFNHEIDVVIDYEINGDEVMINTIRLEHEEDSWFQPAIDQINLSLDYEHLHPWILRDLKQRNDEEEAIAYLSSAIYEGFNGVFR